MEWEGGKRGREGEGVVVVVINGAKVCGGDVFSRIITGQDVT